MAIRLSWGHVEPHFRGRGGRRESAMAPLERAMVVSYKLFIVTVALSVSAAICDRMSLTIKSTGSLWAQISGCFPWSRPLMFGSAESEHPRLTRPNREIISEEFQPMWSQSTNVTDGQPDRQTACNRKTALCTKVHRAVKIENVQRQFTRLIISETKKLSHGEIW